MRVRKPKLGQNFLVDDAARHRIADALGDLSSRTVIEIGPGHGAITGILAGRARRLVCIELDRALAAELRFRYRNHPNVEIVEADVLATPFTGLLAAGEAADVVGNLPYYITSDILLHLFTQSGQLGQAVVMMQREVADRVAALPGSRDYGLLSATTALYAGVDTLFTLPPEAFQPPPEVYSTVLRLRFQPRFDALGIVDPASFADTFLRGCFQQKRKTLGNNLRAAGFGAENIAKACEKTGISPQMRAEMLPLEAFAALFHALEAAKKHQ